MTSYTGVYKYCAALTEAGKNPVTKRISCDVMVEGMTFVEGRHSICEMELIENKEKQETIKILSEIHE